MSRVTETVTRRLKPSLAAFPIILGLSLASPAWGQADHRWITEEPKYTRAKDGLHCCGAEHCKPRAAGFAREVARGWYVPSTGQLFVDGARGLYFSETPEIWACMDGEEVGCLFVHPGGA